MGTRRSRPWRRSGASARSTTSTSSTATTGGYGRRRTRRGAPTRTVAALRRHGERPFVALSAEEVAARTGSAAHIAGVFEATAATMRPARLARGLRRVALQRGVRIFERSPMIEPDRGGELAVRTPGGRVRVGKVVLAVNAWCAFQTLLGLGAIHQPTTYDQTTGRAA